MHTTITIYAYLKSYITFSMQVRTNFLIFKKVKNQEEPKINQENHTDLKERKNVVGLKDS